MSLRDTNRSLKRGYGPDSGGQRKHMPVRVFPVAHILQRSHGETVAQIMGSRARCAAVTAKPRLSRNLAKDGTGIARRRRPTGGQDKQVIVTTARALSEHKIVIQCMANTGMNVNEAVFVEFCLTDDQSVKGDVGHKKRGGFGHPQPRHRHQPEQIVPSLGRDRTYGWHRQGHLH